MKTLFGIGTGANRSARVLSVSANDVDSVSLEHIFCVSGWSVCANSKGAPIRRETLTSAILVLRRIQVGILFWDCDFMPGEWQEMLEQISRFPDPPLMIVTSRLADERLWAESINLGAYDVLAKPFDVTEVGRVLNSAWQHWQDRHAVHSGRTKQRTAASAT